MPRAASRAPSLRLFALLSALSCGVSAVVMTPACGEDEVTLHPRLDGSTDDGALDANGSESSLQCGVPVPTSYVSASFTANVGVETGLAQRYDAIIQKMIATEGGSAGTATAAELKALYNDGAPSLRSLSTTATQQAVDALFDAFGNAFGKTWSPADAESDGGGVVDAGDAGGDDGGVPSTTGGKYNNTFYFTQNGVDIRAATTQMLLGGAFYNHVLAITAAPLTDAVIDQLVASFGATTSFANSTDEEAGANADKLIAAFASNRDDKSSATPGSYRKIKTAVLQMKAAVLGGDKCIADRNAALSTFLLEWERATYATAIFYLNSSLTNAANPANGPQTLHAFGQALGFVQSFKGLTPEKRKISDPQIDEILGKMGATTPYKLVTNAGTALALTDAINLIALDEGFAASDVESFKKSF